MLQLYVFQMLQNFKNIISVNNNKHALRIHNIPKLA